jgi:metal-responsive CopG/Arc/MetJ family transcriptional regulator
MTEQEQSGLTETLSVMITRDMLRALDRLAYQQSDESNRVTRAEVVRDALVRYLAVMRESKE